jgi:nucleoside-diphosphate-sugar epimerase
VTASAGGERRVLVTGATGCIGRRVVSELLRNDGYRLTLLVRDPAAVPASIREDPRVALAIADLRAIASGVANPELDAMGDIDAAVLAATSWGPEPDASAVNVDGTLAIAERLAQRGCKHAVYFSSASILRADGTPDPAAAAIGTPYVRSKARCAERFRRGAPLPATIVYPTLVAAAADDGPASHFAHLVGEIARRASLLRFVSADGSLHAIHAADAAVVVRALIDRGPPQGGLADVVLGTPAVSVDEAIVALCEALGARRRRAISLGRAFAEVCIVLFGVRLSPWDRHCLRQRHFTYRDAVTPSRFGLPAAYPDFASIVRALLPARAPRQ